jgi:MFS family permease
VAPAALRPLRHRSFALVWGGGMVSNTGGWMETVAVGTLIKSSTGKDSLVAVAAVASFLPIGVLSPIGGALADRFERRRFIVSLNLFEAMVAAALAVAASRGAATVPVVTGLVFLEGCSGALRLPFQQAILPDLVPPDELLGAVSLGSTQYNVGRVVGPAVAAVLIARYSVTAAFTVNAFSFLAVVVAISLISVPRPVPTDEHGVFRRIREGARAAMAEPGCRTALGLLALASFTVAPFIALVAGRSGALVGGGEKAVARVAGALTTSQGIGAVIGALLVPTLAARFGRRRMLVINLLLTPVLVTAYAWADTVALAIAAMIVLGSAYIGVLSGLQAVVQLRAPTAYRARILSLFFVALGTLYPIGALWQGTLGDAIGLRWATTIGAVALVVGVAALALLRPSWLAALEPPVPSGTEPVPEETPPLP